MVPPANVFNRRHYFSANWPANHILPQVCLDDFMTSELEEEIDDLCRQFSRLKCGSQAIPSRRRCLKPAHRANTIKASKTTGCNETGSRISTPLASNNFAAQRATSYEANLAADILQYSTCRARWRTNVTTRSTPTKVSDYDDLVVAFSRMSLADRKENCSSISTCRSRLTVAKTIRQRASHFIETSASIKSPERSAWRRRTNASKQVVTFDSFAANMDSYVASSSESFVDDNDITGIISSAEPYKRSLGELNDRSRRTAKHYTMAYKESSDCQNSCNLISMNNKLEDDRSYDAMVQAMSRLSLDTKHSTYATDTKKLLHKTAKINTPSPSGVISSIDLDAECFLDR